MVASVSAYYIELLSVYVLTVGGVGIVSGLYADKQRKRLQAERRRLEYVLRRYNTTTHDNYDPFSED